MPCKPSAVPSRPVGVLAYQQTNIPLYNTQKDTQSTDSNMPCVVHSSPLPRRSYCVCWAATAAAAVLPVDVAECNDDEAAIFIKVTPEPLVCEGYTTRNTVPTRVQRKQRLHKTASTALKSVRRPLLLRFRRLLLQQVGGAAGSSLSALQGGGGLRWSPQELNRAGGMRTTRGIHPLKEN